MAYLHIFIVDVTYVPDVGEELQYTFSCEKDDPDFFHSQMEAFFKKLNLDWNKVDLSNLSLIEKNIKNTNKVYAGVNIRLCKTKNGNFVVLKSTEKCINSEVVVSSHIQIKNNYYTYYFLFSLDLYLFQDKYNHNCNM